MKLAGNVTWREAVPDIRVRRDYGTISLSNQSHNNSYPFAARGKFSGTFLTPQANLTWLIPKLPKLTSHPNMCRMYTCSLFCIGVPIFNLSAWLALVKWMYAVDAMKQTPSLLQHVACIRRDVRILVAEESGWATCQHLLTAFIWLCEVQISFLDHDTSTEDAQGHQK